MRWALLLLLVVLMALAVVAIKLLPWWAVLVGLAGGIVLIVVGVKLLIWRACVVPYVAETRALEGAAVVVHSIEPGKKPAWLTEPDEGLLEEAGPEMAAVVSEEWAKVERETREFEYAYYWIEATITPREPKRGLTHWEPSELELIALEADPKDLDQEGVGEVFEVYIWQDGSFRKDDDDRYPGELRVRLLVGVEPHVRTARFRYYRCGLTEVEFATPHLPDKAADSGHTPGAQEL